MSFSTIDSTEYTADCPSDTPRTSRISIPGRTRPGLRQRRDEGFSRRLGAGHQLGCSTGVARCSRANAEAGAQSLRALGPGQPPRLHLDHHVAGEAGLGEFGEHPGRVLVALAGQEMLVGRPVGAVGEMDVSQPLTPVADEFHRRLPGRRGVRQVEREVLHVQLRRVPARRVRPHLAAAGPAPGIHAGFLVAQMGL